MREPLTVTLSKRLTKEVNERRGVNDLVCYYVVAIGLYCSKETSGETNTWDTTNVGSKA